MEWLKLLTGEVTIADQVQEFIHKLLVYSAEHWDHGITEVEIRVRYRAENGVGDDHLYIWSLRDHCWLGELKKEDIKKILTSKN